MADESPHAWASRPRILVRALCCVRHRPTVIIGDDHNSDTVEIIRDATQRLKETA